MRHPEQFEHEIGELLEVLRSDGDELGAPSRK